MFRIHNRRLFWRLAGRSIKANLGRNLLTALAVFLSTLMLFSIFTIGVNYFRNLQVMMDRLDGVTDALLYAPTQKQYEQIKATPGVEVVGIRMSPGSETIPGALDIDIPLQHCTTTRQPGNTKSSPCSPTWWEPTHRIRWRSCCPRVPSSGWVLIIRR